MNVSEMVKELGTNFEQFKKANDARYNALHAAFNRSGKVQDDVLEAITKVTSPAYPYTDPVEGEAYSKEFRHYMRTAEPGRLRELEQKALSVGVDPEGGYWVTPEVSARIVEKLFESSPIRELATVESTTSASWEFIIDEGIVGRVRQHTPKRASC